MDLHETQVDLSDFDDFGSDTPTGVTSADAPITASTMFSVPTDEADALLSIEKPEEKEAKTPEQVAADAAADAAAKAALSALDEEVAGLDSEEEPETGATKGRPRVDKSGLIEAGKKLLELGIIDDYEEEEDDKGNKKPNKPVEDYSVQDWIDLIKLNQESKINAVKEQTPKEFYDQLPPEMQYAAKYIADGGQDLKGLFRALGEVQEVRDLDQTKPTDQEAILRAYFQATEFGSAEEIEEQIEDYKSAGTLAKWATKHKPKLDQMQQQQVEQRLAQQEQAKTNAEERRKAYRAATYQALVAGEVGGSKIENKVRDKLWEDMTQLNYKSLAGRPTTKLSHNFEKLQFGEAPNMALIAEVNWLMDDPEGYKKHIASAAVKDSVADTARKLKGAQASKNASGGTASADADEDTTRQPKRGITRPQRNIFSQK